MNGSHRPHRLLFAAFLLAFAGVGTAPQAQSLPQEEGTSCSDSDQTGGMGGQSLSCGFSCPGPTGLVSVSADADDSDAKVSGTASCPGGEAHCSGRDQCAETRPYGSAGAGRCSADSDEVIDDGFYVSCSASAQECIDDPDCVTPDGCLLQSPVRVCPPQECPPAAPALGPLGPVPGGLDAPGTGWLPCVMPCEVPGVRINPWSSPPSVSVLRLVGDCLGDACPSEGSGERDLHRCLTGEDSAELHAALSKCAFCSAPEDLGLMARLCAPRTGLACNPLPTGPAVVSLAPGASVHVAGTGLHGLAARCDEGACVLFRPTATVHPLTHAVRWTLD